jgi:hypothetical protein|tara:strand:+ start:1270 stop:1509 length:240 start_codon:yes stop_codon:yes gene_type:complete
MQREKEENIEYYLDIIDEIEKIRKKNNVNWMDILRLAFRNSPDEAKKLMMKVNTEDDRISVLLKKLSTDQTKPSNRNKS